MRRIVLLSALLAAGLLLAGCTGGDEPEESTGIEESTEVPTDPTSPADEAPVEPTPFENAPLAEPTPEAPAAGQPPAAPAPEPPAPAPAPPPAPAPAPAQPPAPASPAPPPPSPAPSPAPTPPPPTPTQPAWPREGSRVTYEVVVLAGAPDGSVNSDWFTNWTWTYTGGDWVGRCEGTHVHGPYDEPQARDPVSATFTAATPPHWPPMNTRDPPAVGATITAWDLFRCEIQSRDAKYAGVQDGWHTATDFDDGSPDDYITAWDRETGLVHHWDQWRRYSHAWGEMTSRT